MKYIVSSLLIIFTLIGFSMAKVAADGLNVNSALCNTATSDSATASQTDLCKTDPTANPIFGQGSVLSEIIDIITIVIGVTSVIMIVISGFQYITSSGDPQRTNSAKNTLLFAIVGLAVAAVAQIIVFFVLNNL